MVYFLFCLLFRSCHSPPCPFIKGVFKLNVDALIACLDWCKLVRHNWRFSIRAESVGRRFNVCLAHPQLSDCYNDIIKGNIICTVNRDALDSIAEKDIFIITQVVCGNDVKSKTLNDSITGLTLFR